MKRRISTLSVEYCKSKKLQVFDMPNIGEEMLTISSLEEQNKNLSVYLEQLKLKEVETSRLVDELRNCHLKDIQIINIFKNCFLILIESLGGIIKEIFVKNDYNEYVQKFDSDIDLQNLLKLFDNYKNFETFSIDKIETEIGCMNSVLIRLLRNFFEQITLNIKLNGNLNNISTVFRDILSEKLLIEKQKLLVAQDEIKNLKNDNIQMKLQITETLYDMDILRHKIYMMHDRYEEKMDELEKKEKLMEMEIQNMVDKKQSNTLNNVSMSNEEMILMQNELKSKNESINNLSNKLAELETKLKTNNIEFENLKISYKLFSEIPIKIKPEYKTLVTLNENLTQENKDLKEYLKIFWDIISQIKLSIKSDFSSFQDYISEYINKLNCYLVEIESERDSFKVKFYDQSISHDREITNLKQTSETIEQLKEIINTLKTQNDFYSNQLKSYREKDFKLINDNNDYDSLLHNDAIIKLKEQDLLLKQLRSQQDAILSEMEITANSYEETFEQNSQLLTKLKEKQDLNLNISSDLFKSHQSIQQLNKQISSITKINEHNDFKNSHIIKLNEYFSNLESLKLSLENNIKLSFNNLDENLQKQSIEEITNLKSSLELTNFQFEKLKLENAEFIVKINKLNEDKVAMETKIQQLELNEKNKLNNIEGNDMILNEQLRIYKMKLTCACCNSNKIDAILTKCYHLFCYSCLEVRYETRQRKCPKCNTSFGNNDFHRIFF